MTPFASRTATLLAASLSLACQQGDPPAPVEAKASEPPPAPVAMAPEQQIAVTITYCIP